jgi:hypothetical protein
MADIKDSAVSFEIAKALVDKGIVVDSGLYYDNEDMQLCVIEKRDDMILGIFLKGNVIARSSFAIFYPAPTADELKLMLKDSVELSGNWYCLTIRLDCVYYWCYPLCKALGGDVFKHDKLCESFAEVVIRLKEAGAI